MNTLLCRVLSYCALLIVLLHTGIAKAETPPFRTSHVRTADGLTIAVQEWGNPKGQAIVLIHGLLQSHLSWVKQTDGPLAKRYHLVTYDLRGHGESDAPTRAKYYQNGKAWAQELDAVLKATQVTRPVLVGWSMGGTVVSDYVRTYGSSKLGGLVYLDSWIAAPNAKGRPASDIIARMASPNLEKRISARTAFLHACYWTQPAPDAFATQLAFNMLTPPQALSAMVNRSFDYDALARRTTVPVLVYHGEHDVLMPVAAAKHTAATFPHAQLILATGVGHASFYENPEQFDQALDGFISHIHH